MQIEAYKVLIKTLCNHYDIPVQTPMMNNDKTYDGVFLEAKKGRYNGIVCHYHVSRNEIDCAGLDLKSIVDQLG